MQINLLCIENLVGCLEPMPFLSVVIVYDSLEAGIECAYVSEDVHCVSVRQWFLWLQYFESI